MKSHCLRLLPVYIFTLLLFSFKEKKEWTPLLDKNLSHWEMYLSFSPTNEYKGKEPLNEQGEKMLPVGYNKNEKKVFSVVEESGHPVLRISGEIYGCVFTKNDFENYHLRLKVKFGSKKWKPRLNEAMDSGILYNSQGPCGVDYWKSWMLSQEFQVIENSMGDYWSIGTSRISISSEKNGETNVFKKDATKSWFGAGASKGNFCKSATSIENPKGEWNTLELISFGDKSLHIVNGKVVMALSESSYLDGTISKPLTKGKIQLQSEAAEIFYKEIEIKNIERIPDEYISFFK